ncbi:MAG: protein phosphatase 2C domain-containing protein, partial [Pseudomonadota bacterium]
MNAKASSARYEAAKLAWVGARPYQEDNFAYEDLSGPDGAELVAVLCDGMGGHAGGDRASAIAVSEAMASLTGEGRSQPPRDRLVAALANANKGVGAAVKDDPDLTGMGSTFIAVICAQDTVFWISVGDSPMWAVEEGRLIRLNADHSLKVELAEQVKRGELTKEEAARHPQRNALTSAVMGEKIELYDLNHAPLPVGRSLLLASDGVETLSEQEIEAALRDADQRPGPIAKSLIAAVKAKNAPKQDNTSVLFVANGGGVGAAPSPSANTSLNFRSHRLFAPVIGAVVALFLTLGAAVWMFSGGGGDEIALEDKDQRTGGSAENDAVADAALDQPPPRCVLTEQARATGAGSVQA